MCTYSHPRSWFLFDSDEEDAPIPPMAEEVILDSAHTAEDTTQALLEGLRHFHV